MEKKVDKSNVIQQYFEDLNSLLSEYEQAQKIIMGDFNKSIEEEEIQGIVQRHNLYDVFTLLHPTQSQFNTHQRGSKRIDYFLVIAGILDKVKQVGYEPFGMGIQSDHRGMYMDISTTIFMHQSPQSHRQLHAMQGTRVKNTDSTSGRAYLNTISYNA